ncbi:uncharacterized protein LOC112681841 [Sipha flava]|uniref:Uncharacterized protein LOC112681841 n=1 Tax=Sipha flava TaxID=143950 RepID=A0A8B8FAW6_9HEMI|nr:uncharacterized protein LOC112681841 [Sipha flava]
MTAPRLSVLIVFAVAAVLLQPSLGAVPTHRIARGLGSDFASKFQEYVNRYSSSSPSASSAPTETTSSSQTQTESAATSETAAGTESAASEISPSVVAKEGSSSSGGISTFQNLIPSSFSQYGQYPSHLSNQYNSNQLQNHLNPGQYISGGSTSSPSASQAS